jgi:hypothetical protein
MVASIEFIEKVIEHYAEAARANHQNPNRVGNVVILTADTADEVMITGDLHGHRHNFNAIRRLADLRNHPKRHLILQEVCHGGPTYPTNGGCMSHTLLEDVAKLVTEYPGRVHFLLGNHELAELTDYPIQKNSQMLNLLFRLGLQQAYGPAADKIRDAAFPFIQSSPLAVRLPGGVFVSHSIPQGTDTSPFDMGIFDRELETEDFYGRCPIFDLVWGRDYREENAEAFATQVKAEVLINGHEPCTEGYSTPNSRQVIVDCCNDKACYVILPTDRSWTQAEVVERISKLKS